MSSSHAATRRQEGGQEARAPQAARLPRPARRRHAPGPRLPRSRCRRRSAGVGRRQGLERGSGREERHERQDEEDERRARRRRSAWAGRGSSLKSLVEQLENGDLHSVFPYERASRARARESCRCRRARRCARPRAKLSPALLISHPRSQLRRLNMLSRYCASSHDRVQPES